MSHLKRQRLQAYDQAFFDRCVGLFLGMESGYMGADGYQHHAAISNGHAMSGTLTWDKHAEHGTIPRTERYSFVSRIEEIVEIVGDGTPVVAFGPVVEISRLIERLRSKTYVPVDMCPAILEQEFKRVSSIVECKIDSVILDFFADRNPCLIQAPSIGVLLGLTISNIPGPALKIAPETELIRAFRNIMRMLPYGGHFLVSMDANQDPESIKEMYNEKWHSLFSVNFLHRMALEIPTVGFDPNGFEYWPVWHERCGLLAHTVRATEDQDFTLGKNRDRLEISVKKGDIFHYNNSFKYRPEFFENCAQKAGLDLVKKWENDTSIKLYLFSLPTRVR